MCVRITLVNNQNKRAIASVKVPRWLYWHEKKKAVWRLFHCCQRSAARTHWTYRAPRSAWVQSKHCGTTAQNARYTCDDQRLFKTLSPSLWLVGSPRQRVKASRMNAPTENQRCRVSFHFKAYSDAIDAENCTTGFQCHASGQGFQHPFLERLQNNRRDAAFHLPQELEFGAWSDVTDRLAMFHLWVGKARWALSIFSVSPHLHTKAHYVIVGVWNRSR